MQTMFFLVDTHIGAVWELEKSEESAEEFRRFSVEGLFEGYQIQPGFYAHEVPAP